MSGQGIDPGRRRFLQAVGAAAVAATGCNSSCAGTRGTSPGSSTAGRAPATSVSPASTGTSAPGRPRVVVVTAKRALTSGYDADRGALRAMLSAGLAALAGSPDAQSALRRYLRPGETVGLKVNGLAGRNAATHVELVDALSDLLRAIGIEGRNQIVFDRFASDLTSSGFTLDERGERYLCTGNEADGYEEEPAVMPSSASRLARVLTRRVEGVVNLPVLKQHMLSGMTGALKNHFGCIHNPHKMHLDGCDPYIAEVNALPEIRGKQRLVVMDALRPVLDNGPSFQPGMEHVANTMLFAVDPVAADAVGLELLDDLRRRRGLRSLVQANVPATHVQTAAKLGLGVAEVSAIDVVRMEV